MSEEEIRDDDRPLVAIFRPDDDRLVAAETLLSELGVTPIADPMLEIIPTGESPRRDADVVVLTSRTGADLVAENEWESGSAAVCAIGEATASALRSAGFSVDLTPEVYSSAGLVDALREDVDGTRIEVARSDHGNPLLLDGLREAGGYVHETTLYELRRPRGAGESTEIAASGHLDAALFTSSLTVSHFLDAAEDRGIREETLSGLQGGVVGVIGEPTKETAVEAGIPVDIVAPRADFESLARTVVERLEHVRTTGGF